MYKHKKYFKENIPFKDDIRKTICFSFMGFDCYKISPMMMSIPGRYDGIDFYLSGEFNRKLDILLCYKKLGRREYKLVKIIELGSDDICSGEAEMVARSFELNYLRKKCRFTIV